MRFNYTEIKEEILSHIDEIDSNAYPEDALDQYADSFVPVYNGEIVRDWQEMPSEFDDSWKELGAAPEDGIIGLMMIDLYFYYRDQVNRAYQEITEEREAA
jgi:hypothetical protein